MSSKFLLALMVVFAVSCNQDDEPALSPEAQLAKDIAIIDAYLLDNGITAIKDESGLRYVVHVEGIGESPAEGGCIIADYAGNVLAVDSTFDDGEIYKSSLFNFIEGWQIAFPKLQVGDSATLYIPSGLGYGTRSLTGIPKNSNLVFGVKLTAVGSFESNPATGGTNCYFDEDE
jgi:FKBP-type peptidyl-prolyl cis-trans isomerase FkpA